MWICNQPTEDLILDNCIPVTESGCWLWTRPLLKSGYGQIRLNYKMYKSHRLSFEIFNKCSVLRPYFICHKCDIKACVNPDHLYIGTIYDNARDACLRGQQIKGEQVNNAVLTEGQVLKIRALFSTGKYSKAKLARLYKVSDDCIFGLITRRTWKHI